MGGGQGGLPPARLCVAKYNGLYFIFFKVAHLDFGKKHLCSKIAVEVNYAHSKIHQRQYPLTVAH